MHKVLCATLAAAVLFACCAAFPDRHERSRKLVELLDERMEEGASRLAERFRAIERERAIPDLYRANAEAASKAESGEYRIASAAWWGWSPLDATSALNAALSAPVDTLIIPRMDGPWVVGPLFVGGPKTILLEPGCEITAAEGEFRNKGDCLLTIKSISGLAISGYGSRLAMRKDEYRRPPYAPSQWRHAIAILESANITIEGLAVERSGGDGVYVGQKRGGAVPTNIVLRDLRVSDNYRQGISVIAANSFRLEYSVVSGTRGHQPQAGIDFEPNRNVFGLVDCTVDSCVFSDNAGAAIHIHLANLGADHPPTGISVTGSSLAGKPIAIWAQGLENGARGAIVFAENRISGLKLIQRSEEMAIRLR